jgi:hypothetical protein
VASVDAGSVVSVLHEILERAGTGALQSPGALPDLFKGRGSVPAELDPNDVLNRIGHPDWTSMLPCLMAWLAANVGDKQLWLGYLPATDWSQMLTLNYTPKATPPAQHTPDTAALSVGLAVTDSTLTRGIRIWAKSAPGSGPGNLGQSPIRLSLSASGTASWHYIFGGGPTGGFAAESGSGTASLQALWNPVLMPSTGMLSLTVGPVNLALNVAAGTSSPLYALTAKLGDSSGSGLGGAVRPSKAPAGLASFSPIPLPDITVGYSPQLSLVAQHPPVTFSLG